MGSVFLVYIYIMSPRLATPFLLKILGGPLSQAE